MGDRSAELIRRIRGCQRSAGSGPSWGREGFLIPWQLGLGPGISAPGRKRPLRHRNFCLTAASSTSPSAAALPPARRGCEGLGAARRSLLACAVALVFHVFASRKPAPRVLTAHLRTWRRVRADGRVVNGVLCGGLTAPCRRGQLMAIRSRRVTACREPSEAAIVIIGWRDAASNTRREPPIAQRHRTVIKSPPADLLVGEGRGRYGQRVDGGDATCRRRQT